MSESLDLAESDRLVSVDAYRGFMMLAMVSGGFAFPQVARHYGDSRFWAFLGYQFSHAPWTGCSFFDLIQPSFMFIVGVVMPFSYARRRARGDSRAKTIGTHGNLPWVGFRTSRLSRG